MATDENQAVLTGAIPPWAPAGSVDEHVNTLEDHAFGLVFYGKNPLHPENVSALFLHEFAEPVVEFFPVAIALRLDAHAADVRVVVMVPPFEEMRIDLHGAVEIEASHVHDLVDRDLRARGAMDRGECIDLADAFLETIELLSSGEIAFIQKNDIGKCDLLLGLAIFVDVLKDMLRIHKRDHAIDSEFFLELLVHKKRLNHRAWIRKPGRLDEDVVKLVFALEKIAQDANEIAAHRAANAAVVHLEKFLVGIDNEFVIDPDFAEFIFDHGDFESVLFGEDAVEKRGLSGSKKAGENGDGYA